MVIMTRYRYPPGFFGVLKLAMTSFGGHEFPAISFQQFNDFFDFHSVRFPGQLEGLWIAQAT